MTLFDKKSNTEYYQILIKKVQKNKKLSTKNKSYEKVSGLKLVSLDFRFKQDPIFSKSFPYFKIKIIKIESVPTN
jgi:hypothetical protein